MKKINYSVSILLLAAAFVSPAIAPAQQQSDWHIAKTFHIASSGGWDYIAVGPDNRLYVSHATQVNILDEKTGDSIGVIPNTSGVHGIAFVPSLGKGYTSNGRLNNISVFDLKSGQVTGQLPTGQNPDAIMYDLFSKTIITCNGRSNDLSFIDPATEKTIATVAVGGKPETAVSDGAGKIYVNIEDKNEIVVVNTKTHAVENHWSIAPAEGPTGLAIDISTKKLFAGCDKLLIVVDMITGKVTDKLPTWSTDLGTISPTGLLSAPGALGVAHVTATSVTDPGKSSTVSVTVVPPIAIVNGSDTKLALPQSRYTFVAKVSGVVSSNVDWTCNTGTITTAGVWTADSAFTGTATITATSKSDNTKSDSTSVFVLANVNVRFTFQTVGDVVLTLRPDKAPKTCANLVSLVNEKFYDSILVHRYDAGSVVQWGDPYTKTKPLTDPLIGTGGPGYTINFEANDLLNVKYSLGMARSSGLDTAGSQIYINLADNAGFDGSYVVFGWVSAGTSVVDALRKGDKILSATVELL